MRVTRKQATSLSPRRTTQLSAAQGASEKRQGAVQKSTVTEPRSLQRSDVDGSAVSASSYAAGQDSTMRRPFAVFDIDGTLIRWQLYHAIADGLAKQGHFDPEVYQEIRAARMEWKKRSATHSFKTYEERLVAAYDQLITRLKVEEFNNVAHLVFEEYKDQVYTYTRGLIKQLKDKGYVLIAISGSQADIVSLVADHYGFDHCEGSTYEQKDGYFTGSKFFAAADKERLLRDIIKRYDLSLNGSVALGDSKGDIPMLSMVEHPVAFNPEQELFAAARQNNWKVVVERKNMIYELEPKSGSFILAKTNI